MKKIIDINCDLGEGADIEEQIMPYISSANIACGFHAGHIDLIRSTISLCLEHDVGIGAHPSFLDLENFGRKEMHLTPGEIYSIVQQQLELIQQAAKDAGGVMRHVKPHGALYNMASRDPGISASVVQAVKDVDESLILFGLSGSHFIAEGKKAGLRVAHEVFADRTYLHDGHLTPRSQQGALILETDKAMAQVMQMVQNGTITSIDGMVRTIEADTICIHGDGLHAVSFAKTIYKGLVEAGVQIQKHLSV